jgi:hypothetical protein
MGFPDKIREEAFVQSGRHCCLCHKFCGTKIEAHHIKLVSDGGDDSFENAIPLCFDCHADMRSYDHKHPKGTKYSETELRRHRDNWYEKIKNNIGVANKTQIVETDKKIFELLANILPWDGSINFIRTNNFGGAFRWNFLNELENYLSQCKNPVFEFVDPDLEGLRAALLKSIKEFMSYISANTWPVPGNSDVQRIPLEWEDENPERLEKVVNFLHATADEICQNYDTLIKMAVRKLGVIPEVKDNDDIFA